MIIKLIQGLLARINLKIVRLNTVAEFNNYYHKLSLIRKYLEAKDQTALEKGFLSYVSKDENFSYSQVCQDLMCSYFLDNSGVRTFAEVGVGDGKLFSNTYLLEQSGWTGILVEPNRSFHKKIMQNRTAHLFRAAASAQNGTMNFFAATVGELSYSEANTNDGLDRKGSERYQVKMCSLNEMLEISKIEELDFLSIDVEGHELQVLSGFDVTRFNPKIAVIETNYEALKTQQVSGFFGDGYIQVFPTLSPPDIWLVRKAIFKLKSDHFISDTATNNVSLKG